MAAIPITSDLVDTLRVLPLAYAKMPDRQKAEREAVLAAVVRLSEGVCQALHLAGIHCGVLLLVAREIDSLGSEILTVGNLECNLQRHGVIRAIAGARDELERVLENRDLELRFFLGRQLVRLVCLWPDERNDHEFAEQLGNLMREATGALGQGEVDQIRGYLRDVQAQLERDVLGIRAAMYDLERLL